VIVQPLPGFAILVVGVFRLVVDHGIPPLWVSRDHNEQVFVEGRQGGKMPVRWWGP
jgi:hypothetical protein